MGRIVADEYVVAAVDESGHRVARRETDGWKEPWSVGAHEEMAHQDQE